MKLAFCIPAYNNPGYLYKCLSSLLSQKNKSFDILISDDCSPIDLRKTVDQIYFKYGDCVNIEYIRHENNKGIYWNTRFIFEKSNHPYRVLMQHDDYIVDDLYTDKILNTFKNQNNCSAIVFNAITEYSKNLSYQVDQDKLIDGRTYLTKHLFRDIHPSYSSVVLNTNYLDWDAYKSTYIDKSRAHAMKVEIDECFQILSLLSLKGDICVFKDVATVRGEPATSATQRNILPFKTSAQGMLVAYYQLYKIMREKGFSACAGEMKRLLTNVFPSPTLNIKLIKFFNYEIQFIYFHVYGIFVRNIRRIFKVIK